MTGLGLDTSFCNKFTLNIMIMMILMLVSNLKLWNTISYPLFVHAIRENINGFGSYHTRLKAECDTNPNHNIVRIV